MFRSNLLDSIFSIPPYLKTLSILLWVLVAAFAPGFDIGSGSLGYSLSGFTVSLIGVFAVLGFCKRFPLGGCLSWVGRNTLNILCAHILLWRILDIFDLSSENLPFSPLVNFLINTTYEIVLAIMLAWLLSKIHILEFKKIFK